MLNSGYETCIMCGKDVEVTGLSNCDFTDTDLDTRPCGLARTIEKNCAHYCPYCGYASFSLEKDITIGNKEILDLDEYQSIVKMEDLNVDAKKFYLIGIIFKHLNEFQKAATSFLRASWFFSDVNELEWSKKSRDAAISEYLKSDFTFKNERSIIILVDLYRRNQRFKEAKEAIKKFNLDNFKDLETKSIINFEIELIEKGDYSVHKVSEIEGAN